MRVLVAAASFSAKLSGIQRHAFNLARCLLSAPEIGSVHFVVAPWQQEMVGASGLQLDERFVVHLAEMDRSSMGRNSWYYRELSGIARGVRAELVHLSYPMPIDASAFQCPTVVSLHDLYPYEIPMNFGFPKFIFNRLALRQCLGAVDAIACVSEATKDRLRQYLPAFSQKAVRIPNCVEPQAFELSSSAMGVPVGGPFLLCVAQHRRNKNLHVLIRAFERLFEGRSISATTRLLVVGIPGPETGRIKRLILQSGLQERVYLREGLAEADLQWCYHNCEVLVSPSVTEGFGLPVAEALLAGCRVVCSEIPAHWEIGAGRCRFVNLENRGDEKLATAIVESLREPRPRALGLPDLSAAAIARQYVGLYTRLLTLAPAASARGAMPIATSESQVL